MTLHEWLTKAEKQTEDAPWLAAKAFGKNRTWVAANRTRLKLSPLKKTTLDRLLKRRLKDEPLAYILESEPFFGRDFFVDKRVLIPRPETEDLVEEALKLPAVLYVDVGTGSGAMAITLAVESPRSRVFASDVSAKALAVAKKNASKHAPKRVTFFQGALLHAKLLKAIEKIPGPVVIVANLPYLPPADKKVMPKSVTKYEPLNALFAKKNGMELNQKLLEQLQRSSFFGSGCTVLLEFDPPQSKKLLALAKSFFPGADCSIIRDRCGRERILKVTIPQT